MPIEGLPSKSIWKDKGGKLHVNIWPKQHQFLGAETIDEVFFGGAAGGGKSEALLHFALQRRLKYPRSLGIIFRRKFPDLQKSLILRSKNYYGLAGGKYNESKHEWKFPNGSVQMFGFCKTDGDVYDHQSAEYQDMGFDELTHFTEFQFGYLTSRCRSSMPGVKALIRGASNPGNIGHIWVKKRYIDKAKTSNSWYNAEEHKSMAFISSLIDDNPSLRLNDPTYEYRLRILGEKKYQALRFGNWDVFEGQYFDEWDGKLGQSVLTQPRIPERHHRKFLSMDWGFSNPSCVLWFEVTPSGRVFVYRELYTSRRTHKELAADILALCPDDEKYEGIYIPPELFGKKSEREGGGEPYSDEMQSVFKSRIGVLKANNARVMGWQKVRGYLQKAPDGFPWIQLGSDVLNLARTMPMMIHDENHPEDLDTDGEDHAPDAFRYGVVALNEIPKALVTPTSFIDQVFGRRNDDSNAPSRLIIPGRGGY